MAQEPLPGETDRKVAEGRLFWSSVLLLFGEILSIRWLGIEIPTIQVFPNLVLLVVLVAASAGLAEPQKWKTPRTWLIVALMVLFATVIYSVPLGIPNLSIKIGTATPASITISIVLLLSVIVSLIAVFVNVGGIMSEGFSKLPPLRAYGINLLASIVGVVLVGLMSMFYLPPPIWIILCGLMVWRLIPNKFVPVLTTAVVIAAASTTLSSQWSPYSKLDVLPLPTAAGSALGAGNYILNANNHYFHFALRMLSDPDFKRLEQEPESSQNRTVKHYYHFLRIPFACHTSHDRVLVLGGGSGNDVAYALAHGAKHVDVVEIDPLICKLGMERHPDRPYLDPRVTLHNEDARTFLRYSKEKFDLIEFAYLDPGTTLNSSSFVRVDNFVYTVESIKSAISHLNEKGLCTISFATGANSAVTRRLYQTITEAQGFAPKTYVDDEWESVLFLIGNEAQHVQIDPSELKALRPWPPAGENVATRSATDDWPFLYLEFDLLGAVEYFGILAVSVIVPALLLTKAGKGAISPSEWGIMFFLGQGFMLVETKSIAQLSLFFGATWIVSSVVIGCVLLFAFIANIVASKIKTVNLRPFYIGLAATLLLDFFFRVPTDTQVHPLLLACISTVIACLPILFSGLIFSLRFRESKTPQLALSANLLGVAVGGLTENLCLVTGIKGLLVIAFFLYALSFWLTTKLAKEGNA